MRLLAGRLGRFKNSAREPGKLGYRKRVTEVTVMYCPQCATPNAGDVKFCRSCGTELESVALVLSGKPSKPKKSNADKTEPKTAQDWLEKRIEGVTGVTRGLILLIVSVFLGV